jgi:cation transport ATPase
MMDTSRSQNKPDGAGARIDLTVTGMPCAACARRIERKLAKAAGVRRAGVNFTTAHATVEYDPKATGVRCADQAE